MDKCSMVSEEGMPDHVESASPCALAKVMMSPGTSFNQPQLPLEWAEQGQSGHAFEVLEQSPLHGLGI